MVRHQRFLKNYLLAPKIQLKLASITVCTLLLQGLLIYAFYRYSLRDLFGLLAIVSGASDVALELMRDEMTRFVWWMSAGLVGLSLISCLLVILQTHRVLGAAYAVTRHIEQNLLKLNFKKPLKLRKKDVLLDLRDAVNELSSKLDGILESQPHNLKTATHRK